MSDVMHYDSGAINTLVSELDAHRQAFEQHGQDANDAQNRLSAAWQGDGSEAFTAAHRKLMGAIGEVQDTLSRAAAAVQNAHDSAHQVDKRIGGMFGA
ncbi:WXG100 family type VII secretion target [Nocardia sp. NPDC127526]|uniref:WXG100 family type VII secretion target n=1 Tax=Nocardia sp. NPDC127526 TaxID=3345393 RepID=UPI003628E7A3